MMKPLLIFSLILISGAACWAEKDHPKKVFEDFVVAEARQDWRAQAEMILPSDLHEMKDSVLESYARAKKTYDEKQAVSSIALTTFKSLEKIQQMSPEDIYVVIRGKTSPPLGERPPLGTARYVVARSVHGEPVVWYEAEGPDQKLAKGTMPMMRSQDRLYVRLPNILKQLFTDGG